MTRAPARAKTLRPQNDPVPALQRLCPTLPPPRRPGDARRVLKRVRRRPTANWLSCACAGQLLPDQTVLINSHPDPRSRAPAPKSKTSSRPTMRFSAKPASAAATRPAIPPPRKLCATAAALHNGFETLAQRPITTRRGYRDLPHDHRHRSRRSLNARHRR